MSQNIIRYSVDQLPHALRHALRVLVQGSSDVGVTQVGLHIYERLTLTPACFGTWAERLDLGAVAWGTGTVRERGDALRT